MTVRASRRGLKAAPQHEEGFGLLNGPHAEEPANAGVSKHAVSFAFELPPVTI